MEVDGIDSASVKPVRLRRIAARPLPTLKRLEMSFSSSPSKPSARPWADVPICHKSDDTARGGGRVKDKPTNMSFFSFGPGKVAWQVELCDTCRISRHGGRQVSCLDLPG